MRRWIDAAAFILDLDGTLWTGGRPLPGAAELLRRLEGRFAVVSNNSTHGAADLSAALAAVGLPVPAERIVLAGELAVALIARRRPQGAVMLLGSETLRRQAMRAGLRLDGGDTEVVLLARDLSFTYAKLAAAANAVRSGARLVAANPDLTHPGPDGSVVPETGSLLQAVLAAAGSASSCEVVGKPEPLLFREALRRLGTQPADTLVIGDNPLTDGAGAERCGLPFRLLDEEAPDPAALLRPLALLRSA